MGAALPFEVNLAPSLLARLGETEPRRLVRDVSYAGDAGGVLLHTEAEGAHRRVLVSLTHVRIRGTLPFATAALAPIKRIGSRN